MKVSVRVADIRARTMTPVPTPGSSHSKAIVDTSVRRSIDKNAMDFQLLRKMRVLDVSLDVKFEA